PGKQWLLSTRIAFYDKRPRNVLMIVLRSGSNDDWKKSIPAPIYPLCLFPLHLQFILHFENPRNLAGREVCQLAIGCRCDDSFKNDVPVLNDDMNRRNGLRPIPE